MVSPSLQSELDTIDRLLSSAESNFRKEFLKFVATVKSAYALKIIRQYLENNQYEEIVNYINSISRPLGEAVAAAVLLAGLTETKILQPKIQAYADKNTKIKPQITLSFEAGNPRAAEIIRNQTTTLIQQISETQRQAIYEAILQGQLKGLGPSAVAKEIQAVIGLTKQQNAAVNNYRRLLEAGSKEALDRGLRDRRFDSGIKAGKKLSAEQIDSMVDGYRARYIRLRAENIARTTALGAISQGREEALKQTLEQTGIDASTVVRTWKSTQDNRTRDTHITLNNQKRGLNERFVSTSGATLMYPGDLSAPAAEICLCRCSLHVSFT